MIPYWIYSRISELLAAIQSSAKPEDYVAAILKMPPQEAQPVSPRESIQRLSISTSRSMHLPHTFSL